MKNVLVVVTLMFGPLSSFGFDINLDEVEISTAEFEGDFSYQPDLETLIITEPRLKLGSEGGTGYFTGHTSATGVCSSFGFERGSARRSDVTADELRDAIFIQGSGGRSEFAWELEQPYDKMKKVDVFLCSRPLTGSLGVTLWEERVGEADGSESMTREE